MLADQCSEFTHAALQVQDDLAQLKQPIADTCLSTIRGASPDVSQHFMASESFRAVMALCRLLAADHRDLWRILRDPVDAAALLFGHYCVPQKNSEEEPCCAVGKPGIPISHWNEQQAIKQGLRLVTHLAASSNPWSVGVAQQLRCRLAEHAAATIRMHVSDTSSVAEVRQGAVTCSTGGGGDVMSSLLAANQNVFIVPMAYSEEDAAECVSVVREGSLCAAAAVAAFSPLLEIPREHLFMEPVLRGRCLLFDAIEGCGLRQSVFPDDTTVLLICLVFEHDVIGPARSPWGALLGTIPKIYPSVPTFWDLSDLGYLDAGRMIDEVLAKNDELRSFHHQVLAALDTTYAALCSYVTSQCSNDSSIDATLVADMCAALSDADARQRVFAFDRLQWARATFDSRAFNLNVDRRVLHVLAPVADMLNHDIYTDVLTREVLPENGPFVLSTGAALTAHDVGREVFMSYGGLQSWELVMSYGFILDKENENDRIPLPLQLDQAVGCEDDPVAVEYASRRRALIQRYGLDVVEGQYFISYDGVPCPAMLALLRVQLAEILHFDVLEGSPYQLFTPFSDELERAVVQTIQSLVSVLRDDFSTTLEEDDQMISTGCELALSCEESEEESNAAPGDRAPDEPQQLSHNAMIAIKLRRSMKHILQRVEKWCESRLIELSN